MRTVIAQLVAVALAFLGVAILVAAIPSPAHSAVTPLEGADSHPRHVRVAYAEPLTRGHVYVELNNGATYRFTPCAREDSRNCYWDAQTRGNGHGHSFVNLAGDVLRIPARFGA